jgi:6-phosphogluconolactonase
MLMISERDDRELYIKAAGFIADRIAGICAAQKQCVLGIVGGRSVPAILDKLLPYGPFNGRIEVFWLDERLHADHKNYAPVLPLLEQLHREGVDIVWHPLQSTHKDSMQVEMRQVFNALVELPGPTRFDLIICSAGEDGHIASLFPGHDTLHAQHAGYMMEDHAPKAPPERVTITPQLITSASEAVLFFIGEKRRAYELFSDPKTAVDQCPAKLLLQVPTFTVFTSLR